MSDTKVDPTDAGGNDTGTTPTGDDGFKPITSQEELNRLIGDRVKRAKPADYDDLKAKAARLDEIEQASKSDLEKAADRAAKAEAALQAAQAESLRWKVAAKFGITDEDADLFLTGTDEATLTKQAERLSGRGQDRKKQGNRVPKEGANPTPVANDERTAVRELFGG